MQTLSPIINQSTKLKGSLDRLQQAIQDYDCMANSNRSPFASENIISTLQKLNHIENGANQIGGEVSSILTQAEAFISEVNNFVEAEKSSLALEIEKKNAIFKWQTISDYKAWLNRVVRWIAGALLVVILYSSLVWLQGQCDFIKIPVRDWITNSQPQASYTVTQLPAIT